MLRIIAIIFGIGFIFAGVAGFFPSFMVNGLLFGTFEVDSVQNLFHIVTGVIAIMAATGYRSARLYFQVFGVIFGLLTISGFVFAGNLGFIKMHFNTADNLFNLVIAIIALFLGFYSKKVPSY